MTFVLATATVTQSGTDTPALVLSGLGAIAGVVTVNMGGYTELRVPYKLIINGSMTMDKSVKLTFIRGGICNNEVVVNSTGVWTAKHVRTDNSTNDYYELPSIDFNNTPSTAYNGQTGNSIYIVGGTLDFAAVRINADGGQYWNGGTIKYRRVILSAQNVVTPNDLQYTTEVGTPTIDWDDVTIIGGSTFMRTVTITNFKNFKPRYMIAGVGLGYGASRTLTNLAPFGCQNDASVYSGGSGGTLILLDPAPGSATKVGPWAAPSSAGVYIKTTASIRLTAIDEFNAVVNSFKVYLQDNITNAYTGTHSGNVAGVQNTYNGTSTGNILDITAMTGESVTCQVLRKRSATQLDDLFAFPMISYLNRIANSGGINLAAIDRKDKTVIMPLDTQITQTVKATVDAYTVLDSSAKFYDFTKSFLFNNYLGESTTYITRSALVANAGAFNVSIDPVAVAVFAKVGNLLTIKASTYAGEITTTGTLTASMTAGGSYTYLNGSADSPMAAPAFTSGTLNIGAATTYGFSAAGTIVSMSPTVPGTYVFVGAHTGTLDLRNAAAHAITVQVPLGTTTTTANNLGGLITVVNPTIFGTAIVAGAVANSRILIRNVTASTTISNVIGTGYNNVYAEGTDFTAGQTYSVTVTHVDKLEIIYTGTVSASGFTVTVAQLADTVYVTKGFDGSTFTGINFNTASIDLDLDGSVDPVVLWGETYARYKYQTTLVGGITTLIGAMFAKDLANFTFSNAVVFNNLSVTPVQIGGDGYAARADGLSMFGTGSIRIDNSTGVLIANAQGITEIKAKTDQLTFTIAGKVDTNTKSVNDYVVIGNGSTVPWGPA